MLVGPGPTTRDSVAERVNPLNDLVVSHSSTYLKALGAVVQLRLPPGPVGRPPEIRFADRRAELGFRPAWIETATEAEWEEFESGYQADEEEWLAAHPDHPEAAEIRQRVDEHRSYWLRGYRGLLGFAYLTLIPVG